MVANVTFAADGSNYVTLSIKNGSDTLASRATDTDGLTAGASEALDLSGGEALDFDDLGEVDRFGKGGNTHTCNRFLFALCL